MSAIEMLSDITRGIGGIVDDVATALTGNEIVGDAAGLVVNLATGNLAGAFLDGLELGDDLAAQARARALDGSERGHPAQSCPAHPAWAASRESRTVRVTVRGDGDARVPATPEAMRDLALDLAEGRQPQPGMRVEVSYVGYVDVVVDTRAAHGTTEVEVTIESNVGHPRPADEAPPATPWGDRLRAVLDDPSLSLEEKVAQLLSLLLEGLDERIETHLDDLQQKETARELADAKKPEDPTAPGPKGQPVHGSAEALGASEADGGEPPPTAADVSRLASDLQMLMQRRSEMQALLSNLMNVTHQTAMQVISNIR